MIEPTMPALSRLRHAPRILSDEQTFVLQRCKRKKVLKVGCADTGLMRERSERNRLLHHALHEAANELWSVDIDNAGIEFEQVEADALHVGDASQIGANPTLQEQRFDVIVATDLLEQLSNPGLFLDSVQTLMVPNETELLVSVPNAFRLAALCRLPFTAQGSDDFNYWFSHATLSNLLQKHGLRIEHAHMYLRQPAANSNLLTPHRQRDALEHLGRLATLPGRIATKWICSALPQLGDGVLMVATRP
jgi:2-polyprenyl-3-methyl-5-hydroxy-6-metoxy-1,4-benzoquinol methylase